VLQKQEIEALYQDLVDQINGEIALVKRRIEAEKVAEEQEKLRRLQVSYLLLQFKSVFASVTF
jgi:hypothetical protein